MHAVRQQIAAVKSWFNDRPALIDEHSVWRDYNRLHPCFGKLLECTRQVLGRRDFLDERGQAAAARGALNLPDDEVAIGASAKYGLLSPYDMIEPYEQTLKTMKTAERRAWALGVLSALRQTCDLDADTFVFLAGDAYRQNLVPHIKHYTVPMEGLAFGKHLQWLERQVS